MLNLLAVRNVCDLLAYSFSSMSTMVFPLSACVTIAFPLVSFLFNSFVIYNCLLVRIRQACADDLFYFLCSQETVRVL